MSRARALLLATLALSLATAPPAARAAEDGGTRSVFAQGAGERALGMGGAFVASADDASALSWNPAGLGLVSRAGLLVSQANDLGLGFRRNHAAAVLPSWRLGTVGVVFRSFGVSAIEERDARNVATGEFSDSELEMALGYGRALGPGLALGGAVKLQRQSLAGYGANALGADLGVRALPGRLAGSAAPWASRWAVGLAVRNAVEPSLRLDRESVPDPMTVRAGTAWSLPAGAGALLAEVDVEATRGADARLHAGVEAHLLAPLALRVGSDAGALTAGAGLRWRDLRVDYAYRDHVLAAEHRVGLSLGFGASVEQSRDAARAREDAALQRRLGEAFQERQGLQLAGLLATARAARAQGDLDGALQALAAVRTLAPDDTAAAALEAGCLRDRGDRLMAAGDLGGARVAYELALAGAPGDTALAGALERCRAEGDRRTRRSNEAIAALDPSTPRLAALRGALARARAAAEEPAPAKPAARSEARPRAASALSERQLDQLYRQGRQAYDSGRPEVAVQYWELVWAARPDYREVAQSLEREYLTRGMESFAAGRMEEAVSWWEKALRVDPQDERARGYLSRAQKQMARSREILGMNR